MYQRKDPSFRREVFFTLTRLTPIEVELLGRDLIRLHPVHRIRSLDYRITYVYRIARVPRSCDMVKEG